MSEKSAFYPVGLNLSEKTVMVVGAGTVAHRKLTRLLPHAMRVIVVSPSVSEACATLLQGQHASVVATPFSPEHLDTYRPHLVFACTSSPEANRQIVRDCRKRGLWVNSATDGSALSDFILPALTEYDDLQIALFSGGASPLLVRKLREDIETLVGPWMGPYLSVLKTVRQQLQEQVGDESQRKNLYESALADEELLAAVQSDEPNVQSLSRDVLNRILPPPLRLSQNMVKEE